MSYVVLREIWPCVACVWFRPIMFTRHMRWLNLWNFLIHDRWHEYEQIMRNYKWKYGVCDNCLHIWNMYVLTWHEALHWMNGFLVCGYSIITLRNKYDACIWKIFNVYSIVIVWICMHKNQYKMHGMVTVCLCMSMNEKQNKLWEI